jgi:hypothetical protein
LTSRLHLTRNPITAVKRSFIIIISSTLPKNIIQKIIRFSLIHALALSIGKDNINEINMTPKKSKTSNVLSSQVKLLSEYEGPFKSLAVLRTSEASIMPCYADIVVTLEGKVFVQKEIVKHNS